MRLCETFLGLLGFVPLIVGFRELRRPKFGLAASFSHNFIVVASAVACFWVSGRL